MISTSWKKTRAALDFERARMTQIGAVNASRVFSVPPLGPKLLTVITKNKASQSLRSSKHETRLQSSPQLALTQMSLYNVAARRSSETQNVTVAHRCRKK
jgi:hypothetical protein